MINYFNFCTKTYRMRNVLLCASMLLCAYSYGQSGSDLFQFDHIALYSLKFVSDSTEPATIQESKQMLLLGKDRSLYGATDNLKGDTATYYFLKRPVKDKFINTRFDNIQYRILKEGSTITTIDGFPNVLRVPPVKFKENKDLFDWQLTGDTATVASFFCQKATCSFGGRQWEAWFTPAIPVSDGPYKFCGLPGLILRVQDVQHYWNFELVSFTNTPFVFPREALMGGKFDKAKVVKKKKYFEMLQNSYDNFMGILLSNRQAQSQTPPTAEDRERFTKWANNAKKMNNWIEPYSK